VLGGLYIGLKSTHCKENSIMFKNVMQGLGLGWILRNDLNNGIWMWDVAHETEQDSIGQVYLKTVAKELANYKLDLMREQDIGWKKGGTESAGNYKFFVRMRVVSERWYFSSMMGNYISSKEWRFR
jgi:hypothetical protein